jgi:DNA topoisomerase-1
MLVAQELYEGVSIKDYGTIGLITYMRTDSLRISNEARDLAKEIIINKFGAQYYPKTPRIYKSKKDSQDAHEAIRPTYVDITPAMVKESVSRDQYRLYKLIWEKFIASQMENAIYETKSADIEAGGYIFKATGSKIKFAGYRAVYIDFDENEESLQKGKKPQETFLPDILEGEVQKLLKINSEQLFTLPPSRYNEATLIKALEENGIGRPSTYAPTVTTIIARGYVVRVEKQLAPTVLGEITTELMKEYFKDIVDITFTANMEKQLDEVEDGNLEWTDVLKNFYGDFSKSIEPHKKKSAI